MRAAWVPIVALFAASHAHADDDAAAGIYGLLDGDLSLDVGAGGGGHASGAGSGPDGAAEVRLRFLSTVSLVLGWDGRPDDGAWRHAAVGAVELRPLFLVLFFENRFTGDAFTDLVLYGIGLTGGVSMDAQGLALLVGFGTEWPIVRTRARGLFLRTELRGRFADESWQDGAGNVGEAIGLVLLQWHAPLDAGLVR